MSKGNVNNLRQESYNLVFMSQILRDVKRNMCDGSRLPGYLAELCKLLLDLVVAKRAWHLQELGMLD